MPVIAHQTSMHYFNPKLSPIQYTCIPAQMRSHTVHSHMQTHLYRSVIACAYTGTHAYVHTAALFSCIHTHPHTNMACWPADGVGLMYFDDMKVDHIYMQIEVPD